MKVQWQVNYLDGIAIGLEQDIYDYDMVRDHLKNIIVKHYDELYASGLYKSAGHSDTDFRHLQTLALRFKSQYSSR